MQTIKKTKRSNKKTIILSSVVLAVLVAGIAGYALYHHFSDKQATPTPTRPVNSVSYTPPTQAEKQNDNQQKTDIINGSGNQTTSPPSSSTPTTSTISVVINRATQDSTGLHIRTNITGTTSGDCLVQLTKSGQPTINKTFPVIVDANTITCQQADIALSEFSTSGEWTLSVVVKKDASQSAAATWPPITITK